MTITFTGRTALILAAGLWFSVAHVAPSLAQDAEPAAAAEPAEAPAGKPIALKKFTRQHAARKTEHKAKVAKAKPAEPAEDAAPAAVADDAGKATLPASIADANAQAPNNEPATDPFAQVRPAPANPLQADTLLKSVGAESRQDAVTPEPGAQVVAPDELNEIDRAASESRPALTLASATLDPPAAAVTSADDTTWDKTSLIGKVFIAFGGLLTMASAARMFMA
jgi:hypothetical protein